MDGADPPTLDTLVDRLHTQAADRRPKTSVAPASTAPSFDTPAGRLRWARERAGFSGPLAATTAFGFNYSSYSGHENGGRNPSLNVAKRYARAFKVRWEWLYLGVGDPLEEPRIRRPVIQVPLVHWSSPGLLALGEDTTTDAAKIDMADLPLEGDWVALEVEGDAVDRLAPAGSTIIVDRRDTKLESERFYVFGLEHGETSLRRYRAGPDRLQPYSTNSDHETLPMTGRELVFGRVRRVVVDLD